MAKALLAGDLEALRMLPRTLRKRAAVRRLQTLSSAQVRALILRHRIGLRELATQSAAT
jgi:hypothetical protein